MQLYFHISTLVGRDIVIRLFIPEYNTMSNTYYGHALINN